MTGDTPKLDDPGNLRAIADDTYDWETWFSPVGRALWVNHAVKRMTGVSAERCLQMADYPLPLIADDDRDDIAAVLRGARDGSSGNDLEFRVLGPDGAQRWVAMSWQRTYNRRGECLGFRTSVRDIEDRKQLELQLCDALRAARAAEHTKAEFLAMMGHELRTPLQSIQGHAELMAAGEPDDEQRRRLDIILGQAGALTGLLDNLLELSALDATAPELSQGSVSVGQLAQQVCDSLHPQASRKGIALRVHGDSDLQRIHTDARALRQVITNLAHNAIKFTDEGAVQLRVVQSPAPGAPGRLCVELEVQDSGPGIAPEQRDQVFEPFVRGDVTGDAGGTGLGLAIARRLTEALGGTLGLRDAPGGGSIFHMRFEAAAATDTADEATHRSAQGRPHSAEPVQPGFAMTNPLRILLVEDGEAARELLVEVLQRHGYHPQVAQTGEQALQLLRDGDHDLALMDLHLPDLDATGVLDRLAAEEGGLPRGTRCVALSAGVVGQVRGGLLQRGFDAVMQKPASIAALQDVLRWAAGNGAAPGQATAAADAATTRTTLAATLRPDVVADLDQPGPDGQNMLTRVASRVAGLLPQRWSAIEAARDDGDAEALRRACHELRGDCLVVGAQDCANAAAAVENLADDAPMLSDTQPPPSLGAALAVLRSEVTRLQPILQSA